jgi:hypothetical protein
MAMTKAERKAVQTARDRVRRYEFRAQLAVIESANTTRETYANREKRIRRAEERRRLERNTLDPIVQDNLDLVGS